MGNIAVQVRNAQDRITAAAKDIVLCNLAIQKLQASCEHMWRFVDQVNACHEHHWNVSYKCVECDSTRSCQGLPVCEICDISLVRAKKGDRQAERERKKPEHQGRAFLPLAFRCPKCEKIHILWHNGD